MNYREMLKKARATKRDYAEHTIPRTLREDPEYMKEHREFMALLDADIKSYKSEIEKAARRLTRGIFEEVE